MLKYLLPALSLSILLSASPVSAQSGYRISLFRSQPTGDFANTGTEASGYALPGWGGSLEHFASSPSWPEGLAFSVRISYQSNQLDNKQLERDTEAALPGVDVSVSKSHYRPLVLTFGPVYRWEINDTFAFRASAGVGAMVTVLDPIRISIFDTQGNLSGQEDLFFQSLPDLTYHFGVAFCVKRFELSVNHSSAKEKTITTFGDARESESTQKIGFINFAIGFAIGN